MDHGNIFVEGVVCPLILIVIQGAEDSALVWVLDIGSSGTLSLPLLDELWDVVAAQLVLVLGNNLRVVVAELLAVLFKLGLTTNLLRPNSRQWKIFIKLAKCGQTQVFRVAPRTEH